jgi:hypothetical protein
LQNYRQLWFTNDPFVLFNGIARSRRTLTVKDVKTPMGTIALLLVYAFFIALLWGNAYFTVLSRGVTQ